MNKIIALILGLYLLSLCSAEYLSLDGKEWTVVSQNKCEKIYFHSMNVLINRNFYSINVWKAIKTGAVVPGSIYSDLRRVGILKDLYQGKNDINYRWVAYDNWTYERTFNGMNKLL